jgi:mono/diheme cytochrome c family protein
MTRKSRARWLAFATAVLVVVLAALFAWLRNLTPAPRRPAGPVSMLAAAPRADAGRAAFARAGCTGCHSAEGRGNPSRPLDGVGARLDREQLRTAAFALGEAGSGLPPAVVSAKRAHVNDPEVEALLAYLQSLR